MKFKELILLLLFFVINANAQQAPEKSILPDFLTEKDSTMLDTIVLPDLVITKTKLDIMAQKQFELLQFRVFKTYPYAVTAANKLAALNRGMSVLKNEKDKKKYFKIVENYLTNEFEAKLKKLSRKQGQILIKLINRQTGETTYDLVKNLKSGWTAFWSNTTAKMFDLNMKTPYLPFEVNEDYLIETILTRAFEAGRLPNQPPATPINYLELESFWMKKAIELKKS